MNNWVENFLLEEDKMKNVNGFFLAKLSIVFIVVLVVFFACKSVFGYAQFKTQFKKLYVSAHSPQEFKDLVFIANCAICHDQNEKKVNGTLNKKFRNPYGKALDELLDKTDKGNKEKIREALKTIESQKAPDWDKTFGELIDNYELPHPYKEETKSKEQKVYIDW